MSTVALPDGRALGYERGGDPDGFPVLFFHGTPGSRLDGALFNEAASTAGACIIGVDRPGFCLSDPLAGRTLAGWTEDVAGLADHLGIDRFAVAGMSGGGPPALAVGALLPERAWAVGVISGAGDMTTPDALAGMSDMNTAIFELARDQGVDAVLPMMEGFASAIKADVSTAIEMMATQLPDPDVKVLDRPEVRAVFEMSVGEAFAQGSLGAAEELVLYTKPWGFDLSTISVPVHVWHGDVDKNVPVAQGRAIAAAVPGARLTIWDGEGHFAAFDHADEILAALAPAS